MSSDSQVSRGELVQVDEAGSMRAVSNVDPTQPMLASWTSLPHGTEDERAATLRYRRRQERSAEDVIGKELTITDLYIHAVNLLNDETGEVNEAVRIVLIAPDGTGTQFVSGGVLQSLNDLCAVYGSPPWEPPIVVVVSQERTKRKRFRLYLETRGRVATGL